MDTKEISFNYFYQMFQDEFNKNIMQILKKETDREQNEIDDISAFFSRIPVTKEEQLSLYSQSLFNICANYIALSNSTINIYPKDTLEFVDLILDTMHENPYKESFLISLQFIYQNYFDCLEKGCPVLMSSEDSTSSSFLKITLDSHYQITQFDAINMDSVEEDKIMTKLLLMETNKQIGPIPKVLYYIRKDI